MSGPRSDPAASVAQPSGSARRHPLRARGQVLVTFVFALGALFAILALVIDVGNIWNNSLHVQQAAEAAAMAGVPYMPGDLPTASTRATDEAKRNGFWAPGATVTPAVNPESNRRLDVPMGSPLSTYGDNSGNFWAAAMSQGANRGYGDAYGTYYNPKLTTNNQYDARGYQYAIEVPVGAGATNIDLFDPSFCAVDPNLGTGDHWIPELTSPWPATSTYFNLWSDPAATPLDYSDDVQVASSGDLFATERQVDKSAALREGSASWPGHAFWSLPDCTTTAYHNKWWTFATVVSPGTYRLQVTTTNQLNLADQRDTSSENMWGLRAVATDPVYQPRVYGLGKMVIYANVTSGTTLFYLGQIEAIHAGKTMVIQLFDPGDASGNSSIEILQPTATGYVPATFNYTVDAAAPGPTSETNIARLRTTINGASQFNNFWVTLTVPLPKTYAAPLPPGEPAGTLGGWWKIRYTFDSTTSDTTTWQVSIRGNPVHLVLP